MFLVLSHHYCRPGQVATARERMDQNGQGLTKEPGFLYRYRLERPSLPNILSALTAWNDEADYQRYRDKRFGAGHDLKDTPYQKVDSETYQVHSSHGSAPAP